MSNQSIRGKNKKDFQPQMNADEHRWERQEFLTTMTLLNLISQPFFICVYLRPSAVNFLSGKFQ
jgi:hypothetical protein